MVINGKITAVSGPHFSDTMTVSRHSKLDVASRIYLHNPPGEDNALQVHNAPAAMKHEEHHLEHGDPKVNVWTCLIFLVSPCRMPVLL
jgi:hypothetical protein